MSEIYNGYELNTAGDKNWADREVTLHKAQIDADLAIDTRLDALESATTSSLITNGTPYLTITGSTGVVEVDADPTTILDPIFNLQTATDFRINPIPTQVVGLVPVFHCCDSNNKPAHFTLIYSDFKDGNQTHVEFNTGGVTYSFYSDYSYSIPQIQSNVDIGLTSSLLTAVVTVSPPPIRTIIIYAPVGSGVSYNGITITVTVNGKPIVQGIFSGGVGVLDCACNTKNGLYNADSLANDEDYMLPVFATDNCHDDHIYKYNNYRLELNHQ